MRVLHIIKSLHKAGAEKLCIDICNELYKRENVEVLLLSMSEKNDFDKSKFNFPFRVIDSKVLPSISKTSIVDDAQFIQVVNEFKPDIIHSHLFWAELLSRYTIFPNLVYISHCHDNMAELNKPTLKSFFTKSGITKLYERYWMLKKYKKAKNNFIVISKDSQLYFERVLPENIKNIKLLHNAIDVKHFCQKQNKIKNTDKIKLVNIGRFAIYKNQQFLIDVVRYIKDKGFDVELNFLGEGLELENVKIKVSKYKLEKNVFFHGNVNNVNEFLWDADIYTHAAYYEPFGLVLLEAMAAGLPVVTLNGKGNSDIISQGKNAFMIENQNHVEFGDVIINLWKDNTKYLEMSNEAKKYAQKFDLTNYIDKLVQYYNDLLNERRV